MDTVVADFPLAFCQYKLLPELIQSLQFADAGSKALKPILTIGSRLKQKDFDSLVMPAIVNLFQSSDRQIRLALCEKMHLYIENITDKMAKDTIYPNLVNLFNPGIWIYGHNTNHSRTNIESGKYTLP
jgi:SCY1-like protein 1